MSLAAQQIPRSYKIKREAVRILKNIVLRFPALFAASGYKKVAFLWNKVSMQAELLKTHPPVFEDDVLPPLKILNLGMTSGFGETTHPDVLYVPGGFHRPEWRYLMSVTPFPSSNDYFENPEFLVSENGIEWMLPIGACSPLVAPPDDWFGYYSDPSLLYENGTVFLFFRKLTIESRDREKIELLCMSSTDSVCWTEPLTLLTRFGIGRSSGVLMSPSVLRVGDRYFMWYVDFDGIGYRIVRQESTAPDIWFDEPVAVSGIEGVQPWHLDVIDSGSGGLTMALCAFDPKEEHRRFLVFATSSDMGLTWRLTWTKRDPGQYFFSAKCLYRSTLCQMENGDFYLYYSARGEDGRWFIAVEAPFVWETKA